MTFEIDYTKLSTTALKDLILQKDPRAHEEYLRRTSLNDRSYCSPDFEEFLQEWNELKLEETKIEKSIDYKKLTIKELRRLITLGVKEALDEFDRRIQSSEIKRRSYSIKEIEEMIANPGLAKKLRFI
ncbi:MAG: hypothetical protein A3B68_09745 [Candidatus Melainabacteria bacterium RIFCSPHIGHO2_02_FULL_34_12]|nr:MAG: hypothetical protein A3B68_09745 [Candidatus Melainabacteria bacterium RIFCSPHIGHO2_02_FULL_34_12]